MNVKKTVAGVMAGAMAVSAMATTASALDAETSERALTENQFTLSYDLNSYVLNFTDTTVILKTNYRESEYLLSKVNKYTKTKTVTVDGKTVEVDDTDYPDYVELGATLNNTPWYKLSDGTSVQANYDLQSLELEATSVAQADNTKTKVNELYFSKVILGKDITDLSNESYAIEDSDGLGFVLDSKGNYTGVKVAFNTKDQAKRGSFIVDNFLSADSVKNQDLVTFTTYKAAKAAADVDSTYTEVEEVTPETTLIATWTGATTGLKYTYKELESLVDAGDAVKVDETTYKVAYKKKNFTLNSLTPLWTGGDWVIGVDDGTTKAAFVNDISKDSKTIVTIDSDDNSDFDAVKAGNRFGTKTAAQAAIDAFKKDKAVVEGETKEAWTGSVTGNVYDEDDLKAMVEMGDAVKVSDTKYKVNYKNKYFTLDNLTALYTGGDWVVGLDDGKVQAAFVNNIETDSATVVTIDELADYGAVKAGNRYGTKTAAEAAIKAFKDEQSKLEALTKKGWKGETSNTLYDEDDLKTMVELGDAEKIDDKTYSVNYKTKYLTIDKLVPLYTGGDWVIGLQDGDLKAAFIDNVAAYDTATEAKKNVVIPVLDDSDYNKVKSGNRYSTRTACETAIAEYKKSQEKDKVAYVYLPSLTVAQGAKVGDAAETYLKFGDFYLLNADKATETLTSIADGKKSLENVYKDLQTAIDKVKSDNPGATTQTIAKALYENVGFTDSLASAQALAHVVKEAGGTITQSASVTDVEPKRAAADAILSQVMAVIDPDGENAEGTHLGEIEITPAAEGEPTHITLADEYASLPSSAEDYDTSNDDLDEVTAQYIVDNYSGSKGSVNNSKLYDDGEFALTAENAIDAEFAALEWEYNSLLEQIKSDEATLAQAQADLVAIRNGQPPENNERTENQQQSFILDLINKIDLENKLAPDFRKAIDEYYGSFGSTSNTTPDTYFNDHVFANKIDAENAGNALWRRWFAIPLQTEEAVDPEAWRVAYTVTEKVSYFESTTEAPEAWRISYAVSEDVDFTTVTAEAADAWKLEYPLFETVNGDEDALGGVYYITTKDGKRKTAPKANPTYSFETFTVTATYKVHITNWDNLDNYTNGTSKYTTFARGITSIAGNTIVNATIGTAYYDAYPMRTTLSTPGNVITSISSAKEWGNRYTSPLAVLNDVIANNEEVELIFNSSKKYVDTNEYISALYYRNNSNGTYDITYYNSNGDLKVAKNVASGDCRFNASGDVTSFKNPRRFVGYTSKPDGKIVADAGRWYNEIFDQHLYQSGSFFDGTRYNADGTNAGDPNGAYVTANGDGTSIAGDVYSVYGSTAYTSWNTNLFAGGLVVNSGWTMQLSDTTAFTWGKNTLTFKWSEINANTYNGSNASTVTNFHNVLTSMLMYTPVDWYWDSLDVVVGDAVVEDVSTTAPLEDDGETVVDEPEEAEEAEEAIFEEEPEEEEYYEEDEEDEYYEEDEEDEEYDDEDEYDEEDEYYDEEDEEEYYEEDDEEEYYEEDDEEEYYEEETEEPEEPEVVEVTPTPATPATPAEVPSPRTGNSPIALAVIPVALAAAAVVAKKRG